MIKSISNLKALNGQLLIEPLSSETVTASGLIIPDKVAKRKPKKGLVRKAEESSPVKEGEIVLYPNGHGIEVTLKDDNGMDKTFEIVKDKELLLVI